MLDYAKSGLCQEQIDELNAIFGLGKEGKKKKRELVWDSALAALEVGAYQVIPLTSSWALRQEGRAMQNCVGGYVDRCTQGRARVFSIRDRWGDRVATVLLVCWGSQWLLEQIKGIDDADVSTSPELLMDDVQAITNWEMTDLYYVAHEVARCYRKAWEERDGR